MIQSCVGCRHWTSGQKPTRQAIRELRNLARFTDREDRVHASWAWGFCPVLTLRAGQTAETLGSASCELWTGVAR